MSNKRKAKPLKAARITGSVVLANIHPADVSSYYHRAVANLTLFDSLGSRRIVGALEEWSSANVATARNSITARFLDEYPHADWLLWIDSDMAPPPDALDRLLDHADPVKAPIVGGLCFGAEHDVLFPTLWDWREIGDGDRKGHIIPMRVNVYPQNAMLQVGATGAAFLLVHRSALVKIRDRAFNATFPWFQETELAGKPCGEDVTFCMRAAICELPVYVNTAVKVGHHKSIVLTEDRFLEQRGAAYDSRVGMTIPTRGDHLDLLRATIAASGLPPHRVVVVATTDEPLGELPATVIVDTYPINIHRWWNRGIDALREVGCTLVAVLNDDVAVGPETLPRLAAPLSAGATMTVTGTEGLSGWCFMLNTAHGIRPDESYRWWFGDNQLWHDANALGGVVRVPGAFCAHIHPNASTEASPALQSLADADRALFVKRHNLREAAADEHR